MENIPPSVVYFIRDNVLLNRRADIKIKTIKDKEDVESRNKKYLLTSSADLFKYLRILTIADR